MDWWLTIWEMAEDIGMFVCRSCFTVLTEILGKLLQNLFCNSWWLNKNSMDWTFSRIFRNKLMWMRMSWNWLSWVTRCVFVVTISNRAAVFKVEARVFPEWKMRHRPIACDNHVQSVMAECFMQYDLDPKSQTVHKGFCLSILQCMREAVWNNQPELWQKHLLFLHRDNTPSHTGYFVHKLHTKNKTPVYPLPSYCLHLQHTFTCA